MMWLPSPTTRLVCSGSAADRRQGGSGSSARCTGSIPKYEGVTGNMKFQEGSGDPIKSAVILQVKGD